MKDSDALEKLKKGIEAGELIAKENGGIKLNLQNPSVIKKIMEKAKGFKEFLK